MSEAYEPRKHYTYADYLTWEEDYRAEIIDGELYMMTTPSFVHQSISGDLFYQFKTFLKGKPCKIIAAPFAVRLFAEKGDDTVVEPDLMVLCDNSKIGTNSYNGAPTLVVEILSPSTASKDRVKKMRKYIQAGVQEYWLLDPDEKTIMAGVLKDGQYAFSTYDDTDGTVPVTTLPGCTIDMTELFPAA
ncbi:MAG: Uma2 family endonuclease [Treponema sp.]|jgi:Uma2 family endonuclease|nr:Uma2 family endonuclease [Treponema sp.]